MSKIQRMRELLLALMEEHERDGALPTSVRFLFYELVQRSQIPKKVKGRADRLVSEALMDLRESGQVAWEDIVDETRDLEDYSGHSDLKAAATFYIERAIELDPWRGNAPLIITESRSLCGALRPVVQEFRCKIAPTNGQCGGFLRTDIGPALKQRSTVLYLGDWDVAGEHIEENTHRVLTEIVGRREAEHGRPIEPAEGWLDWEQLALTEEQVEEYDLPTITKRDNRYADGREHEAVETEALRQSVLMDILRARLTELLPEPLDRVHARERRERKRLVALLERRPRENDCRIGAALWPLASSMVIANTARTLGFSHRVGRLSALSIQINRTQASILLRPTPQF